VSEVVIEIEGLDVKGFHGATAAERERGQKFLFDITVTAHDAGVRTDQLADTVDYTQIVELVQRVSDARRFNLIEALAAAVADEIIGRFDVSRVRVRVRKPEVVLAAPSEYTAATVERTRR
jgi:7,8-dihydroneopterin aldolase/epimerase/oxygenase